MKGLSSVGRGMELRRLDDMIPVVCQSSECLWRLVLAKGIFGEE